jgi:hypothetical protein
METFNFIQATTCHNLKDPHSKALNLTVSPPLLVITTQSLGGEGGVRGALEFGDWGLFEIWNLFEGWNLSILAPPFLFLPPLVSFHRFL